MRALHTRARLQADAAATCYVQGRFVSRPYDGKFW